MALIVSVSGVRGIVGTELTPEVALRYAAAFAAQTAGRLAVGRDSRPSGGTLRDAIIAAFTGIGRDVEDYGIVPTPTFGMLLRDRGCGGGIQITASHNPAPYNGLKLFGPNGAVCQSSFDANCQWADWDHCGRVADMSHLFVLHQERVASLIDVDRIRIANYLIVLDANGGAGGPLALALLNSLNCRVVPVACEPDGQFRHEPEPTPENLRSIEDEVRRHPGAIGAALDPDSDRLVLIDETGNCLSEEATLALAIQQRLRQERGPVVINLSTSRMTEDLANAAGVPCHRSAVGEANVVARMREVGALIGGEGNGGVIDPRVGWVRDPFIGLGLILSAMAETGKSLRTLAAELPQYAIAKRKYTLPRAGLPKIIAATKQQWPTARTDESDGLRLEWDDCWVQLRGSNTEPIVRVIAEALELEKANELCNQVAAFMVTTKSE